MFASTRFCNEFDENSPEDDDLRVMVELNNPRIYQDVKHILYEDQKVRKALKENKNLPFPCHCHQLCEYGKLITPLVGAFNRLYEEYKRLHNDYLSIFSAFNITTSGEKLSINDSTTPRVSRYSKHAYRSFYGISTGFRTDSSKVEEKKLALIDGNQWYKTCELHMEYIRLYMRHMSRPWTERLWLWLLSHFRGERECICFHCGYRDALIDYRQALIKLHLEYLTLYAHYYGLFNACDLLESWDDVRAIRLRSTELNLIKNFLDD